MEDLIARDAAEMDLADISPALMNISTIDGHTYGMPAGFTTQVVFYNKDMFAAAGIAEPQAGWTWDDLRAAAAQFRDAATNTYGFAVDAKPDPFDFEQFYWSNGTQFISDDGTTVDGYMNSAAGAEVLDMFADMIKTEEAVALNIGDDTSGSTLFKAGRIAMFQSAMWSMTGIQSSGINFGVVVLPNFGDQPAQSAIGASAMSIAKDAAEPELAWEFVKFFSSPEAVAMRTGDLPIRMSVAAAKGLTEDPIFQPFFTMLDQTTVHTAAFLQNENWGRIQENLSTAIEATMIDQGNAQAHLDEAVARSARFLN
jgi:multiple sugar transport system substrate-binding protein